MADFIRSVRSSSVMFTLMAFWKASASILRALSIWLPSWAKLCCIWLWRFWPICAITCVMAVCIAAPSWVCSVSVIWDE